MNRMLDRYEGSKSFTGENRVQQSLGVKPGQIWKEYDEPYTDVDMIHAFERDMRALEEKGLIRIVWFRDREVICQLLPVPEQYERDYEILGRENKRDTLAAQAALYRSYLGRFPEVDAYCQAKLERLETKLKAEKDTAAEADLLALLCAVLGNTEDLLERELSIRVFGDSKRLEKQYRKKLCRVLEEMGEASDLLQDVTDEREREQILLGEHRIYANPSYVYLKGEAELRFAGGEVLCTTPSFPLGLSSQSLESLQQIRIRVPTVMTVENLTSFHRMRDENTFFIFLSGYHNTAKQTMLRRMAEENAGKQWLHFGDLDPSGFAILSHLRRGTGIAFSPYRMGAEVLEAHRRFGQRLTEEDSRILNSLLEKGEFSGPLQAMRRLGIKVEQEIISLELARRIESNG